MDDLDAYLEWQHEPPKCPGPFRVRHTDGEVETVEIKPSNQDGRPPGLARSRDGQYHLLDAPRFEEAEWKLAVPGDGYENPDYKSDPVE